MKKHLGFKEWNKFLSNPIYKDVLAEIQENFVDDYLNFEDQSVGIYFTYKIDEALKNEINEDIEACTVEYYEDSLLILKVDELYYITIELLHDEYFSKWEIVNFYPRRNIS